MDSINTRWMVQHLYSILNRAVDISYQTLMIEGATGILLRTEHCRQWFLAAVWLVQHTCVLL